MRYLVKARPRSERRRDLIQAVEEGSVAYGGHEDNMRYHVRLLQDGTVTWVLLLRHASGLVQGSLSTRFLDIP